MSDAPASPADANYSCHSSLEASEPVWAHATRVDAWLLLGHPGPWGAKALAESDLSTEIKDKLTGFEQMVPNGRVQFIRQTDLFPPGEIPVYLARSDSEEPWLRTLTLSSYDQLLALDLPSQFEQPSIGTALDHPIFLICVNGKRDLCCALYGQGVYQALAAQIPERAWQTTHLGGHRFAATGILLPYGVHYGRLRPHAVPDLLNATEAGELYLPHMRGFTIHGEPAQAADYYLRQELKLTGICALRWLATEPTENGGHLVRFEKRPSGEMLAAHVRPSNESYQVYMTTGDPEPQAAGHYTVERVEV
jgi:hypothetical protein